MKLENLNLVELNAQEVQEIEGGIAPLLVYMAYSFALGFTGGVAIGCAKYFSK